MSLYIPEISPPSNTTAYSRHHQMPSQTDTRHPCMPIPVLVAVPNATFCPTVGGFLSTAEPRQVSQSLYEGTYSA